ncbi:hypothetical protein V7x_05330 [Crateriforma conspicua]|uniref:Uncharacterized protein n=2 Tax=Crateriforma conspicua TaxID=2527996 RepID=A0A5C6FQ32_9PLAN|nr:hypothetical protein V7x_05330 [Crateriforma conspicua]
MQAELAGRTVGKQTQSRKVEMMSNPTPKSQILGGAILMAVLVNTWATSQPPSYRDVRSASVPAMPSEAAGATATSWNADPPADPVDLEDIETGASGWAGGGDLPASFGASTHAGTIDSAGGPAGIPVGNMMPPIPPAGGGQAASPIHRVAASGDFIGFSHGDGSGSQTITVLHTGKSWMAVYHVDSSGKIWLRSSRPIDADFSLQLNATSPLPDEIRQMERQNRSGSGS